MAFPISRSFTKVATVGIEIPRSIRRRMRTRWLHSTCCRVAVPVAEQLAWDRRGRGCCEQVVVECPMTGKCVACRDS